MNDVRVHVASVNTCSATELCVRSARKFAGLPFDLVVGDGMSTDGTLPMLRRLERRGWLQVEVAKGMLHGDWLDRWLLECPSRYCVFADSDVEFLEPGWLTDMMVMMRQNEAALVCAHYTPADPTYVHPTYGAPLILGPRPSPWLMLLDLNQVRDIKTSFLFHTENGTSYDVAGWFFHAVLQRGLTWRVMPAEFLQKVHHFGGMSWGLPGGGGNREFVGDAAPLPLISREKVRLREWSKRARVRYRLERLRWAGSSM